MAYASRSGRARTNARNPQAFAVCSRCGFWYNLVDLTWQMEWRGPQLVNTRILVCTRTCLDVPQEQRRTIRIPPDPVPVINARPENFTAAEESYYGTEGPAGSPYGLEPGAIMPNQWVNGATVAYNTALSVLSAVGSGTTVTVTLSSPHTFTDTYPQVSVTGLTNTAACGFFTVTPVSTMVFTYTAAGTVSGSLLGGNTRIVTCLVGLPLGVTNLSGL